MDNLKITGSSSVSLLTEDTNKVVSYKGTINIKTVEPKDVIIYNVNGVMMSGHKCDGQLSVSSDAGVYIVKVGDKSYKLIVQ